MNFDKTFEKQKPPTLDFFHEGKKYSIPRVKSAKELWPMLHGIILPALEKLKEEKATQEEKFEVDLCLAWFVREGEDFHDSNPEAANALKELLKDAGFKIPDIANNSSRFTTSRDSFLNRKRKNPHSYWSDLNSLFVLMPASALERTEENDDDYLKNPGRYKLNLAISNGIAITLSDLMSGKKLRSNERVYNDELMDVLDRLIKIRPA